MKSRIVCALLVCAACAWADEEPRTENATLTYDAETGGPWAEAGSWVERLAPIAGDSLVVTGNVMLTDADAATAGLASNITIAAGSTLVVSNEQTVTVNGIVSGAGSLLKLGCGLLDYAFPAKMYLFEIKGGTVISNGTIRYARTTTAAQELHTGPMQVWTPGVLDVADSSNFYAKDIRGDGVICNSGTSEVQLRFEGVGVWDGILAKNNHLRVYMPGDVVFTCETNELNYGEFCTCGGTISFPSFGMKDSPSTTGYANTIKGRDLGGTIRYLGTGETTDKDFLWSRSETSRSGTFDAGAHGGLRLTGSLSASYGGYWQTLYLTGSNTAPAVIAGAYVEASTSTSWIIKKGTGTWHFAETTANRDQKGVYEVREGVLRFDSIAKVGAACSLGPQNRRVATTNAVNNVTASVPYCFLLGTTPGVEPVLEYTGVGSGETDRMLAVAGTARLRNTSSQASLVWHGGVIPYGTASGVPTLILEGVDGVTNRIDNLHDDDGRTFNLVVDGGAWELGTNNTFSGKITVRRGRLLAAPHKPHYTWIKWVARETEFGRADRTGGTKSGDPNVGARQIALFDETGSNVCLKAFHETNDLDLAHLQPGWMTYDRSVKTKYPTGNGGAWDNPSDTGRNLNRLVDGATSEWLIAPYNDPTRNDHSSSWVGVVFRFPDDVGRIVAYDVWPFGTVNQRGVCDWALYGSEDGVNWLFLHEYAAVNPNPGSWFSGSTCAVGAKSRTLPDDQAFLIEDEDTSGYGLPNAAGVETDVGAEFVGRADLPDVTPTYLKVSDGDRIGSWRDFAIPATGVLDVQVPYPWFRMTVKETLGGYRQRMGIKASNEVDGNLQVHELQLYDALGTCVSGGLQMAAPGSQATLQPGYVCYNTTGINDYSDRKPDRLFDGGKTGSGWCATRSGAPRSTYENTWITITFRLADGLAPVTSYDWLSLNGGGHDRDLREWLFEASRDGVHWATVDEVVDETPPAAGKWYFDGSDFVANAVRTGYPLDLSEMTTKVNLRDFACSLDAVGCTGVSNFRNWTVKVNGVERPDVKLVFRDGRFTVLVPSTTIYFR